MLLTEEEKEALVSEIVKKARDLLLCGETEEKYDSDQGFTHKECRLGAFLILEHGRQKVKRGQIKSGGLDIWFFHGSGSRKVLSVKYLPFEIHVFSQLLDSGGWIEMFMNLDPKTKPEIE